MRNIKIRPISVIIAAVDTDTEQTIAHIRQNAEDRKRQIELNFQAAALLDGAAIDLDLPEWSSMWGIAVDLGRKPDKKRAHREFCRLLNTIRQALGCPLKLDGKRAVNGGGRWVEITLRPTLFPGVKVTYQEKLPRNPELKCKIVTKSYSYKELVCSIV